MNKKDIISLMEAYDEVATNEIETSPSVTQPEKSPVVGDQQASASSSNLETSIGNITNAVKAVDAGDVVDLLPFIADLVNKAKKLIGLA
jgi:hypothetical protein